MRDSLLGSDGGVAEASFPDRGVAVNASSSVLMTAARSLAASIGPIESKIYLALICAFIGMFVLAARFFTVEADEAWILLSTMNAVGIALPATDALASPTVTSGGLHFIVHGLLALFSDDIFLHRLISIGAAAGLIATPYLLLRRLGVEVMPSLAGTALFCATPGFILQASLATAEVLATNLIILACLFWVFRGRRSSTGALVTGLVLGLACATRVNCLTALPAIVAFEFLSGAGWRTRVVRAVGAATVALCVLTIGVSAYVLAARGGAGGDLQTYVSASTGVGQHGKSLREILRYLIIGNALLPVVVMAAMAGGFAVMADRGDRPFTLRLCAMLFIVGLAGWVSWLWKSPIPHVRYLWPAIPLLWLTGVVQLVTLVGRSNRPLPRLAFHGLVLSTCGYQLLAGALAIANGESLTLVYQANGASPQLVFDPAFQAARDQRALADFVRRQPPHARFYALNPPLSYPITYLSGRTIALSSAMPAKGLRYIVSVPADFTVWRPTAEFLVWRKNYADLSFVRNGFSTWRVHDGAPAPPQGVVQVGREDPIF